MNKPIKIKTRKNLLGRDVKVSTSGNKKTREVTGNYVSKTRTSVPTKGGKKVTKSRLEVDPVMNYGSVRNVTKYTGLAGLKRAVSAKPGTERKKVFKLTGEVDPKRAAQTGNKLSVRELVQKKYKGDNMPRKFKG